MEKEVNGMKENEQAIDKARMISRRTLLKITIASAGGILAFAGAEDVVKLDNVSKFDSNAREEQIPEQVGKKTREELIFRNKYLSIGALITGASALNLVIINSIFNQLEELEKKGIDIEFPPGMPWG